MRARVKVVLALACLLGVTLGLTLGQQTPASGRDTEGELQKVGSGVSGNDICSGCGAESVHHLGDEEIWRNKRSSLDDDPESPEWPQLSVKDEVVVNTTNQSSWTITCRDEDPDVYFEHDIDNHEEHTTEEPDENGIYTILLTVTNPTPEKTGFIHCSGTSTVSTYVYFDDWETEVIILCDRSIEHRIGDRDITICCRPTNPKHNIALKKDGVIVTDSLSKHDRWTFDPHKGFILKELTSKDTGLYKCNNENFSIKIKSGERIDKPTVMHKKGYFVEGYSFTLECMINFRKDINFSWDLPPNIPSPEIKNDTNGQKKHRSSLKVLNATVHHSGDYVCNVEFEHEKNEMTLKVKVKGLDEAKSYVEFDHHAENATESEGKDLKLVIAYKSFPGVDVHLFRGSKLLEEDGRIIKTMSDRYIEYTFKNVSADDFGKHTIKVETIDGKAKGMVNCTFLIKNKPRIELTPTLIIVPEGERREINATVSGYPGPNIKWFLTPFSPDMIWKDFQPRQATQQRIDINNLHSSIEVEESSGILNITAENREGKDVAKAFIIVTDIGDIFVFNRTDDKNQTLRINGGEDEEVEVVEGDVIKFQCGGVKFVYDNLVFHKPETSSLKLNEKSTNLTKIKIAEVNVSLSDNGNKIFCSSTVRPGLENEIKTKNISLRLIVKAQSKPKFTDDVRMNRTWEEKSGRKVLVNCTVDGSPKPDIIWTKDGKRFHPDLKPSISGQPYCMEDDCQNIFIDNKPGNGGRYQCIATNRAGRITGFMDVIFEPSSSTTVTWLITALVVTAIVVTVVIVGLVRFKTSVHTTYIFNPGCSEELNKNIMAVHQTENLPYHESWEIDRRYIVEETMIGFGAFGRVLKGKIHYPGTDNPPTTVAIKMCKKSADPQDLRALESELKILCYLGQHLNIVNLVGANTVDANKGKLMVMVEYCLYGDLLRFMINHREKFVDQMDPATGTFKPTDTEFRLHVTSLSDGSQLEQSIGVLPVPKRENSGVSSEHSDCILNENVFPLESSAGAVEDIPGRNAPFNTSTLVCWAWQISQGMEYLSYRKILHGDLALRNLLLTQGNVVKISDFGMSRNIYKSGDYVKKTGGNLPLKWMSIEAIRDLIFSTQSDVWSFGVVLWELFTLGSSPYPGLNLDQNFFKLLKGGYRMEKPTHANNMIYGIMTDCWLEDPQKRPLFDELSGRLHDLLHPGLSEEYVRMNKSHEEQNKKFEDGIDLIDLLGSPDFGDLKNNYPDDQPESTSVKVTNDACPDRGRYLFMKIPTQVTQI
ncbi:vascular endothelial growth factor receptor 3-like [Oratosquilla oratoria]|uniref:vascular endothelial growth factor receptor 3-like n=1 Tax=Oratosquilla oratoria TaxID=337810 RepID=UPI003F75BCDD